MSEEEQPTRVASVDDEKSAHLEVDHAPTQQMPSTARAIVLVMTCSVAVFVNIAGATAVGIALPTMGRDLNIPEERIQWIVSAFALTSGCFLLLFGRLADIHGRKRVFLIGNAWTCAFSIGCALAQNEISMDILRGLQGAGSAASIPAAIGILAAAFPPSRERSLAFATFSACAPLGGAFGSTVGGVLTQLAPVGWRASLYLIAGLAAASAVGGFFVIDPDIPISEADRSVDWIGAALVTVGLCLITFVLSQAEIAERGWGTPYIIALLIVGVLLVVLFLFWEHYMAVSGRLPLLRLKLWTRAHGRFAAIMSIAFLNWSAFISYYLWAQLYYQSYEGRTPIETMVRVLPMAGSGFLCNVVVALVVGRIGGIYLIVLGCAATGCACLLFAIIDTSATYWAYGFPAMVLSVFGADFVFASGTLFVAKIALPGEQSVASALFQTMNQVGTSVGLAVSTTVHNRVMFQTAAGLGWVGDPSKASEVPKEALLSGYRAAQYTSFGFAMVGLLVALLFLRNIGIVGHTAEKIPPPKKQEGGSVGRDTSATPSNV